MGSIYGAVAKTEQFLKATRMALRLLGTQSILIRSAGLLPLRTSRCQCCAAGEPPPKVGGQSAAALQVCSNFRLGLQ